MRDEQECGKGTHQLGEDLVVLAGENAVHLVVRAHDGASTRTNSLGKGVTVKLGTSRSGGSEADEGKSGDGGSARVRRRKRKQKTTNLPRCGSVDGGCEREVLLSREISPPNVAYA